MANKIISFCLLGMENTTKVEKSLQIATSVRQHSTDLSSHESVMKKVYMNIYSDHFLKDVEFIFHGKSEACMSWKPGSVTWSSNNMFFRIHWILQSSKLI